ncbi:MAG TPA: hypothetical protein VIL37_00715 [Natronosporangium sp.]
MRGAIAAMAMSGLRRVSTTVGMLDQAPPEAILQDRAPGVFYRVPVARRPALVEAAHIGYGTLGGVGFGLLPARWRRHTWAGPVYGLLFWAGYEAGIRPLLGLARDRHRRAPQRLALIADHLLYGVVVAASPWPYRD